MANNSKKKSGGGVRLAVEIGAGVAALAAGAAAAYFLTGDKGVKNRKKIKAWMLNAKKEVVAGVKKMEKVNKAGYNSLVKKVVERYKAAKDVSPQEIASLVKEINGHWKNIEKHLKVAKTKVSASRPKRKTR